MKEWRDKNEGINPQDPSYDSSYAADADHELYEREELLKEMNRDGN